MKAATRRSRHPASGMARGEPRSAIPVCCLLLPGLHRQAKRTGLSRIHPPGAVARQPVHVVRPGPTFQGGYDGRRDKHSDRRNFLGTREYASVRQPEAVHSAAEHDRLLIVPAADLTGDMPGGVPGLLRHLSEILNKKMTKFVGLGDFAFLLQRPTFRLVIFQSCLFAITSVVFKALIGFIGAHLMHNISGKHQRIWRGLLLVPWVIPLALSTLTWWWMFDPSYSAFNWVLNEFGLKSGALARRGLDRAVLHHHRKCLVRHAVLHDHVPGGAQIGARAAV